jgi:methylglutaconyl-CoA hydratase
VHRALPDEARLDEAVRSATAELLGSGPLAVGSAKELIRAVSGLSLEEAIPVTSKWIAGLRATPEAREGMAAFLGKRKPRWMG